ncbi:MAG TPA: NAD(P) transhydrogenase subunit alpha [bacterium]|nr:NAD(P) transhydrogenase subunit alpha [bacterium]
MGPFGMLPRDAPALPGAPASMAGGTLQPEGVRMHADTLLPFLYIFLLAVFGGIAVISKVPALLHTPLMAFTNAISGISLVASLVLAGGHYDQRAVNLLGLIAVTAATINVVGGFLITDRMLKMFRKKGGEK